MKDRRKKWIEAGNRLAEDPTRVVSCPACGKATLEVFDVPLGDTGGVERYLRCPACGATESLLIRHPIIRLIE